MFLTIIEEFHLELGKIIEGSTISIGGERKKQKISATLNIATITSTPFPKILQGTEDATKWNECLSPAIFALMHKTFFDKETRNQLGIPHPNENVMLFSKICIMGNFLLAIKRIKLGPGPMAYSDTSYNRLEWPTDNIPRMNTATRIWMNYLSDKIDRNKKLRSSGGMLMGMHNAASITIGLIATGFNMDKSTQKVVSLRSSDDSMSIYVGNTWEDVKMCIQKHLANLSMASINMSEKKTFFYSHRYGEYTS
ncbi:hypothetical protein ABEB36_000038 [Hypothenemus hampei]|uniref:RdRp catalytic domain-containing protein n=1 Tax=Hypothenemus hampei TaxID=57062 RepID=A0ABD1FA24_HYPHA